MKLAGIILAAGESRRMGRPKTLLDWSGETVLDHMIGLLAEACQPVIVVLGHQAGRVRSAAGRAGQAVFVVNSEFTEGMPSSLQCGLRAVPEDAEGVMFTPADHPAVRAATVQAIARALHESEAPLAVPAYRGRRGHPVAIRRALAAELLELPTTARASDVIQKHLAAARLVEIDDAGIIEDMDDPAAYDRLRREAGR